MKFLNPKKRVHQVPRVWSNKELRGFASLFDGDVVNVSAWKDEDKEGSHYRDYFSSARSYSLTNYKPEARGYQGAEGEIFLDLEEELSEDLVSGFDVVFNHTTLEHVFEIQRAFKNLCDMSRDVVVTVIPFLQQYHADYGDYWRMTPLAINRMFEKNGLETVYQSFNGEVGSSVYVLNVASKFPERWRGRFDWTYSPKEPLAEGGEPFVGSRALLSPQDVIARRLKSKLKRLVGRQ